MYTSPVDVFRQTFDIGVQGTEMVFGLKTLAFSFVLFSVSPVLV